MKDLFLDMKDLVDEQAEVIDEVESNVEVAAVRAEAGVVDLKKASDYRQAYRKKVLFCGLCVFLILVIIGIILGVQLGGGSTAAVVPCVKDVNGTCA